VTRPRRHLHAREKTTGRRSVDRPRKVAVVSLIRAITRTLGSVLRHVDWAAQSEMRQCRREIGGVEVRLTRPILETPRCGRQKDPAHAPREWDRVRPRTAREKCRLRGNQGCAAEGRESSCRGENVSRKRTTRRREGADDAAARTAAGPPTLDDRTRESFSIAVGANRPRPRAAARLVERRFCENPQIDSAFLQGIGVGCRGFGIGDAFRHEALVFIKRGRA